MWLLALIALIVALGLLYVLWYKPRLFKDEVKKSLEMTFFRVLIPRKDVSDKGGESEGRDKEDFKATISIMTQLFTSFHGIGDKTLSFEILVEKESIYFYVVVPFSLKDLVEKQVTSYYPDAIIDEVEEYTLFREGSYQAAANVEYKKTYDYPIKIYDTFESDPLNNITNSLSRISEEESAVLQISVRPAKDGWQKKSKKLAEDTLTGKKREKITLMKFIKDTFLLFIQPKKEDKQDKPHVSTPLTDEIVRAIEKKSQQVGFYTWIRVITSAPTQYQADNQLLNIKSAFAQFSSPNLNNLVFSPKEKTRVSEVITSFLLRKTLLTPVTKKKRPPICSVMELSTLFHFPNSKYNKTSNIKWQYYKRVAAPDNLPKEGILLGHNTYRGVTKEVRVKLDDRFRHFYIIGQTGTGKSTLLQVMARQDFKNGYGACIMDPHGDLARDLIPFVPRERADDVIWFDPTDSTRPMGLNLLEADTEEEREFVALEAMNIMIKLFGPEIFGPRIQDYFRNGVLTLMSHPEGGAITDVLNLFVNEEFQKERIKYITNPIVKSWWENTYNAMGQREKQEMIPYFAAKFGQFITNSTMRNIIGQSKSAFRIDDVMQEGKLLFLNLSKGVLGDINTQLLGMIIVSKIQVAALRRQRLAKEDRKEFFLYIDEFQNFVTDSIESILSEARKYRLGLVLGHQYIDQLTKQDLGGKTDLKGAVFGNVGNMIALKIGAPDAEALEKEFGPYFSQQDLVSQDALNAACKISVDNQSSKPFSLQCIKSWLEKGDKEAVQAYIELSRLKYGRDREFVDREIFYRIGVR